MRQLQTAEENRRHLFFDPKKGISIFESLLSNRFFALSLLFSSLAALLASLVIFNGTTVLSQTNPFELADLYKISLLVHGVSPYSTEPWAAPYPPFYFLLWSLPYALLSGVLHLSSAGVFTGFRLILALALCACTYLIYKSQVTLEVKKVKAISTASLFLLCSLVVVIYPVGDALGLVFLAGACVLFALKSEKLSWLGILLVSLAVAFKIHPILGAALLLVYYYSRLSTTRNSLKSVSTALKRQFTNSLVAFLGLMVALVFVPILVIPNALNAFVFYNAQNIQHYTFNVYAALYDIALNISPATSSQSSFALDAVWVLASALLVVYLARSLFGRNSILKQTSAFYAIDFLSLGILAWLLVLKQTMPHYFLWALIPLVARGRTKSLYYVLAAEFFGMVFFGLAQAFTTNFFSLSGALASVPGLGVSLLLLAGGVLFDLFTILAMKELISEMRQEKSSRNITLEVKNLTPHIETI